MRRFLLLFMTALIMGLTGYAHATVIIYTANLSGPNEFPTNPSPGTGAASVTIDSIAETMALHVAFSGLTGTTVAAHIHCCTPTPFTGSAGVATSTPSFPNFPAGVSSGTYDYVLNLLAPNTLNAVFVAAHGGTLASSTKALLDAMALGETYLNIHTSTYPGGEIRGFLTPSAVPEPESLALLALGVSLLVARQRKGRC